MDLHLLLVQPSLLAVAFPDDIGKTATLLYQSQLKPVAPGLSGYSYSV